MPPNKPASLKMKDGTKHHTKDELKKMMEQEEKIKGNSEKVTDIPDHLDDLAKEYYKYITEELEVSGLLSNLDIPLVEQTADCLSRMREADIIIQQRGVVVEQKDRNSNDIVKKNPAVDVKLAYLDRFNRLSNQLGMSPSSRAALAELNVEQKEKEDDLVLKALGLNK